ncbi:hypothetical protein A1_46 [Streptococcus phage A1]|nr:hypothetical protein A1_46 [Streptococcus phage A1]
MKGGLNMINNLPLELASEPSLDYLNGQPHRTRVTLTNADGAYYPVFFEPDAINKSLPELLTMALDVVYNKNFSQRAEDERFELLDSKIAESDAATNRANEAVKKIETQIEKEKKTSGTAQASILELITLLYFKGVISDEDFTTITSES